MVRYRACPVDTVPDYNLLESPPANLFDAGATLDILKYRQEVTVVVRGHL